MSNRTTKELVPLPTKKAAIPGFQPAGTNDQPDWEINPRLHAAVARHVARVMTPSLAAERPSSVLFVIGEQGSGKSSGVMCSLSRLRIDAVHASSSDFSGDVEGASVRALADLEERVAAVAQERRGAVCAVIDDIELAFAQSVERTVNGPLLEAAWQHMCDRGGLRVPWGRAPIITTGNSTLDVRPSVFRHQRADFFVYEPTPDERVAIVGKMFPAVAPKDIRALVKGYAPSIAFWASVRTRLHDDTLDEWIARVGMDFAALDALAREHVTAVDTARLKALATEMLSHKQRSFLRSE